jgi:hypothetical protein
MAASGSHGRRAGDWCRIADETSAGRLVVLALGVAAHPARRLLVIAGDAAVVASRLKEQCGDGG